MTSILITFLLLFQTPAADPQAILAEPDGQKRAAAIQSLLRKFNSSMTAPLIKVGDADPSPVVRKLLVERLGRLSDPAVLEFLERRATTDADPEVSISALDQLRFQQARRLEKFFNQRLQFARPQGDTAAVDKLIEDQQRWVSAGRGATLPSFLQQPPPAFQVISANKPIRVLVFSDFGTGNEDMKRTASAALAEHRKRPFDFGLTVGDNLLSKGVTSLEDPLWKTNWLDAYDRLGIPIYATTGNHDWGYSDSPAAEILYSQKSSTWRMPALYYSFTAGPVQFFALCTPALSETQLRWLDRELARSRARWKVVYGHYSIYSNAGHGDTPGYDKILLPLLRNRASMYISGHDHVMQHLKPEGGVHFIVNGAAGQGIRPAVSSSRTLYAGSFYGFTVLEAGLDGLKVSFVDSQGETRYKAVIDR